MTYVVCEPCHECKYTDCVVVCPTECFYQDESMLYIDPTECIDCGACVPECPVDAIFRETEVPTQWANYLAINAKRSAALKDIAGANVREKQDAKLGGGCVGRK
jgi:ferredoxin